MKKLLLILFTLLFFSNAQAHNPILGQHDIYGNAWIQDDLTVGGSIISSGTTEMVLDNSETLTTVGQTLVYSDEIHATNIPPTTTEDNTYFLNAVGAYTQPSGVSDHGLLDSGSLDDDDHAAIYMPLATLTSTYEPVKGGDDNYVTDANVTTIAYLLNLSVTPTGTQWGYVNAMGSQPVEKVAGAMTQYWMTWWNADGIVSGDANIMHDGSGNLTAVSLTAGTVGAGEGTFGASGSECYLYYVTGTDCTTGGHTNGLVVTSGSGTNRMCVDCVTE